MAVFAFSLTECQRKGGAPSQTHIQPVERVGNWVLHPGACQLP